MNELERIRAIVRKFIEETDGVPYRAIDCNQDTVGKLLYQMEQFAYKKTEKKTKKAVKP